jgi:hypothetical protein
MGPGALLRVIGRAVAWVGGAGSRCTRPRALVLFAVAAAGLLSVVALSAGAPQAIGGVEHGEAEPAGPSGRELVARRTARSRTFVHGDGGRVVRVWSSSVNFRRSDGSWDAVDNALRREPGGLVNSANRYRATLPESLDAAPMRVAEAGRWISLGLRGAGGSGAAMRENEARYDGVLSGVDAVYETLGDGVKESLVLGSAASQRRMVFDVAVSDGLSLRRERDGSVVVVDGGGVPRFVLPAPFMVDADGRRSRAIDVDVSRVEGGWRMTLTPDDG